MSQVANTIKMLSENLNITNKKYHMLNAKQHNI